MDVRHPSQVARLGMEKCIGLFGQTKKIGVGHAGEQRLESVGR
jgi:hypothetical protein